ncbi:unnamed protein product [Rodentolepis nana]|uniref:GBD/FH3 domain-containing protein n=1 Tax=Rodentolepis nana TaxID=102285 RepID=A0A0R3TNK3_RODNA|nr:unnamed protein product [Rodentolepis nana]
MGNTPGFPEAPSPYLGGRRVSDKALPKTDNFEIRWQRFVESLDVTEEKMKLIDLLPLPRKMELVLNYELSIVKISPEHCVESIKLARISQITASKRKQDHDDFRKIFTSVEVSLRTNKIEWVLSFLENQGLEAIVVFMGESLKYLSRTDTFRSTQIPSSTTRRKGSVPTSEEFGATSLARREPTSPAKLKGTRGPNDRPPPTPNFSLSRNKSASPTLKSQNIPLSTSLTLETLKDCIHLCLKCFKTLLNNQDGCAKAFENPEVIEIITFCILHPNFATKALALDLLSAICLIGGGHPRVLKAFDYFRRTIGENACFETIINDFRIHDELPLEQYNLEYSVACIQFINIVVHSPENINLRVYLQYTFTLLGLDDFLRVLQSRPGDKLNRHVEAYVNNMVNCSLLLDDAEAKEAAVEEIARLKAALEASDSTAKQQAASFKQRDLALSELVESLRGKIRDINVAAGQQEAATKRIAELEQSLAAAHRQIQRLQEAAAATSTEIETNSLGQLRPAPNPRQKKSPGQCNMTTSTTLPMGFEFTEQSTAIGKLNTPVVDHERSSASPMADPRRKSMSLELLSTTNRSVTRSDTPLSSTSPLSTASRPSSGSEVNYDTFSRKSGSIAEKSHRGIISCTLISKVSDMALARHTFANITTTLNILVSRLAAASCPTSPYSTPAVPLPHWHSTSATSHEQHRNDLGCGSLLGSARRCHQLASVLPDPWASCFVSAHRAFRLCSSGTEEENEEATMENGTVSVVGEQAGENGGNGTSRLLKWLVNSRLVTDDALSLEPPAQTSSKMETEAEEEREAAAVLPLVTALLSVSLNPFTASRILSLLEVAGSFAAGNAVNNDSENSEWSELPRLFDAVEAHLRVRLAERDLKNSPVYQVNEYSSPDWPLMQALLQINLLPFALMANLQLIIEQLSMLSACCNSIVISTKLPTVLRITEALASTLLGKPDFLFLEVADLSSLVDWCLLMRRKSSDCVLDVTTTENVSCDTPNLSSTCHLSDGALSATTASNATHRRKPFMEALYKAVELAAPEALDWTHDIVHLDAASRILPSDLRDRLRELEYGLSLRDAIFPAPEIPGHLQYLVPDAWAKVNEVKATLTEVEVLLGAAAYCVHSATAVFNSADSSMFSDRDFAVEMGSLARFYSSFKKWSADSGRKARNNISKASSCKAYSSSAAPSSGHRRDNGAFHRQRSRESAPRSSTRNNGHDKHDGERKRHNSRHLNTVGIMDNILAGLDSEPLYADVHKTKVQLGTSPSVPLATIDDASGDNAATETS